MVRRRLLLLLLLAGMAPPVLGQNAAVSGFVVDADDGEPLEGVNVVLRVGGVFIQGTATDGDGQYVLAGLKPDRYVMTVSFIGYATRTDTLVLARGERRTRSYRLQAGGAELDEVLVESERSTGAARVTAGQQTVQPADIELIPAPDVSGDLATLLATLPGVVTSGDRGGQLFVRGGEPTQNLVLIDGILLYQPFHVIGFYSAFPSDILSRTDIYAGGFGSAFGERISSVIDVSTRNGNNRRFGGAVSLSPFISSVRLEGPLVQDRVSVMLSARQSVVEEAAAEVIGEPLPFSFGDAFGKMHLVLSPNQRLAFTALRTHDRGTLGRDVGGTVPEEVRWENEGIGARYLILPRRFPVSFEGNASYSRLESDLGPADDPTRSTAIENVHGLLDATFFTERAAYNTGMSLRIVRLASNLGGLYQNFDNRSDELLHWGMYVQPDVGLGGGWRLRPGLRVQFFDVQFEPFFEPRVQVVWEDERQQVSAAAGLYHQAEIGLYDRRDAASIFTAWTNAIKESDRVEDVSEGRVQRAWHALLGYRATPRPWLELSVEGFYKYLDNLFISEWTAFPRFTTNLQPATGRSFGFDLRAEVRRAPFYGYLTYGFSNTRYFAEQAEIALWYGVERLRFRPPHDRRHQVNALASATLRGIDVSARWEFGAGLPFSRVVGFDGFAVVDDVTSGFDLDPTRRVIYERPFSGTLPAYHRLDLSAGRTFDVGRAAVTLQGSLINAYDRDNLFYLDI
ncbi:MAG: TonB-dependent receptor, partial [Rhodothermales bacterium]|nr:TonB-dependent receptor [Rhodothermales bacterium]